VLFLVCFNVIYFGHYFLPLKFGRARAKNGSAHFFENRFFIFVCLVSMGYVDGSGNPDFTKIAVICPLICKISVL